MVGKFQTGDQGATFVRQIQDGINAGNLGSFGLSNLQENLAKQGASSTAIAKFTKLIGFLKNNELQWAKDYLRGEGPVSDSERRLVQEAIGSVRDPVGKLKTLAASMRERALFDKETADGFKQYRKTHGQTANFGDYLDSDEYENLNNAHNQRLATVLNIDPEQIKGNTGFKIGTTEPPKVTAYSDSEKEKRFQAFKASQSKAK